MRAVIVRALGSLDDAELGIRPDPVAGEGEVVVEIHAAPVNYVDLVTIRGHYQFTPTLPYTPGKGPAGVISVVGPGVEGLAVGDRVLAMAEYGGYAEQVTVDARQVHHLPDSLSFADAASMSLAFDTAWMALRERARLASGDRVLVLGATGAVGGAAVRLARALGASQVLASVSSPTPDAIERVERAGADAIVDLSRPHLRDSVRDQVLDVTGGHGVDVVVDALGGDPFDGAIRSVAWRGRVVVVGFAAGRIPSLKVNYLLLKNIEISGLQISDYRRRMPELVAQAYREVFDLYEQGLVTALPFVTAPLAGWREALLALEQRSAPARHVLLPR